MHARTECNDGCLRACEYCESGRSLRQQARLRDILACHDARVEATSMHVTRSLVSCMSQKGLSQDTSVLLRDRRPPAEPGQYGQVPG